MWLAIVIVGVIFWLVHGHHKNRKPIFGVYKQPGKWYFLKYVSMWLLISLRRYFKKRNNQIEDETKLIEKMEVAQPFSDHAKAFDAVFFIGANQEGYYFIMGTERRKHGIINGLCYILTPDGKLYCSRKIPDTVLFGAHEGEFGAEGISINLIKPMKQWNLKYYGEMWLKSDPSKIFNVKVDLRFESNLPYFNVETDTYISALCRSMARENWSREYFDSLKSAHQTHYEQMGAITGKFKIGDDEHTVKLQGFRDHSYGLKRDWDLMHRYAFHMIFLENGLSASIGVISQPCTCSTLETGFVCTPSGELHPVEWCDLKLYQHGEGGTPPIDYAFQFKAGETVYTVQVKEVTKSVHYVGWKWEARMVERFLTYDVNGIPGRGVSEFHYHNGEGRPNYVTADDPEWFQKIEK